MRRTLVGLAFALLAACSSSSSAPDPTGNWDVTLTFTTGTCSGLPPTYAINFDITRSGGGFTITAEQGLSGDTTSGSIACTSTICELEFTDTGPGAETTNIDTQMITAILDLDKTNVVTGSGTVDFVLVGGATCSQDFTADGDVVH
jgi:hypothetical protein